MKLSLLLLIFCKIISIAHAEAECDLDTDCVLLVKDCRALVPTPKNRLPKNYVIFENNLHIEVGHSPCLDFTTPYWPNHPKPKCVKDECTITFAKTRAKK